MLLTLIQGLTKAEKRNFRLYVSRLGASGSNAKFMSLYEAVEKFDTLDQQRILEKCPEITKVQLPNLKAHLYKQILLSLSGLYSTNEPSGEIRQMITFASILFDKALVTQCLKMADKAKEMALAGQFYTLALEVVEFEKRVELIYMSRSTNTRMEILSQQSNMLTQKICNINELSNLAIQLYNLNLKLGYMRSQKDSQMIISYFSDRINSFDSSTMDFLELQYYYQCRMWYSYIQYDFLRCYRWTKSWNNLFEERKEFKTLYYDMYIRSCSRLLDIMLMTRQEKPMKELIDKLENEAQTILPKNNKARIAIELTMLLSKANLHFLTGEFKAGTYLSGEVDEFVERWADFVDQHHKMLLYYKIACLYFGSEDYRRCIFYLQKIIGVRNPTFRRDLQVFARILNLIASYEIGDDETLDYQIRSVYTFIVKNNDMNAVQKAIIGFLRRITRIYASEFKSELQRLYNELKPLESHPYQQRPFFYLDIISWLESKLSGRAISQIRREKINPLR